MLSPDEMELAAMLGECWNRFAALPDHHPSDAADFVFHIHALQNPVMARSAVRAHPNTFFGLESKSEVGDMTTW